MSHVLVDTAQWRFTVGTAVARSRQGGGRKLLEGWVVVKVSSRMDPCKVFVEWILAKVVE